MWPWNLNRSRNWFERARVLPDPNNWGLWFVQCWAPRPKPKPKSHVFCLRKRPLFVTPILGADALHLSVEAARARTSFVADELSGDVFVATPGCRISSCKPPAPPLVLGSEEPAAPLFRCRRCPHERVAAKTGRCLGSEPLFSHTGMWTAFFLVRQSPSGGLGFSVLKVIAFGANAV